ncbi:MAG: DUF1995 family protein [Synechococcus sp. MED-G135]|jgi:hypothetical protein|nr:MAG: DUF1995 family protein [Synechococcus sp. MED-G135]
MSDVSASLPADLKAAEADALEALLQALRNGEGLRWSVTWRFEGLRVMPVGIRFMHALRDAGLDPLIAWSDAGAAALAQRDAPELADVCCSLNDLKRGKFADGRDRCLLAMAPQPSDYEEFESVCDLWSGPVVMLNGRLEDAAVGIGNVARTRRKGFVSTWQVAYWLQPLGQGALQRQWPDAWWVFRQDADGHRGVTSFEARPEPEAIEAALYGDNAELQRQMGAMDRFLNDLSN